MLHLHERPAFQEADWYRQKIRSAFIIKSPVERKAALSRHGKSIIKETFVSTAI